MVWFWSWFNSFVWTGTHCMWNTLMPSAVVQKENISCIHPTCSAVLEARSCDGGGGRHRWGLPVTFCSMACSPPSFPGTKKTAPVTKGNERIDNLHKRWKLWGRKERRQKPWHTWYYRYLKHTEHGSGYNSWLDCQISLVELMSAC